MYVDSTHPLRYAFRVSDDGEREPIPLLRGSLSTEEESPRDSYPGPVSRKTRRRDPSPDTTPAYPQALFDRQLDPELRLRTVLDMCQRAYEEYQEACIEADSFGAGSMPHGTDDKDLAVERDRVRGAVRRTYARWFELTQQARHAETDVRKRSLERPVSGPDEGEYQEIYSGLLAEYEGLGAHYELMCSNCARLTVKLRRMETSGRDYESGEYNELHKLYLSYINQLQKYTEAMKSESINRQTQEVAETIIQIFERHFGQTYPQVWNDAVQEIRSMVERVA